MTAVFVVVFFGGIVGVLVAAIRQWHPRYVIGLGVAVLLSSIPVFMLAVFILWLSLLGDAEAVD